jgi:uncharacterized protein YndB with AHSA1/START domain
MTTKEAKRFSLAIKRVINAPRDRVYRAWTDPAQLKEWFGPEKVRTRELVADVRVGGTYRWDVISPDGEEMTCLGQYRELDPGKKVVFTWQWEDDEAWVDHTSVVTVELFDCPDGTELHLTHEQLPNETSREGHSRGWNSTIDKLEKMLNK